MQSGTQNWQKLPENNWPFKLGESKRRDRRIGRGRQEQLPLSSSGSLLPYCFPVCPSRNLNLPRTSPYETSNHAGSVTRTNFLVCSYWKFKPSWLGWNSRNKTKIVEHKLVLFATVLAFWTLITLLTKVICSFLKWKYIQEITPLQLLCCKSEVGVFMWEKFMWLNLHVI